jgi:glycosyltransferase involved in cell wall biosynthesis
VSGAVVSLIMPNLDMAAFLPEAFASIARQQASVKEVLFVDAGSSDDSIAVAAGFRARGLPLEIYAAPGANPAQARNAALEKASGEIIGFLDADDLFPAGKLDAQLARLESAPAVQAVSGIITLFETLDRATLAPAADSRIESVTGVNLGACLFRRQVFDRIGVFDETHHYAEDTDLILRVFEARIPVTALRRETLYYRRHPHSLMSRTDPRKQRDFHRAVARSLKRRAALGLRGNLPRMEELLEPQAGAAERGA